MGRSTVRVIGRTRPTDNFATTGLKIQDDEKTVQVHFPRRSAKPGAPSGESGGAGGSSSDDFINNAQEDHAYKLDHIMKDASQETVFEVCALDIVKSVMEGFNGTVMAYGQTGAGKTYTMMGGTDYRTRGIVPRSIKAIYDEISSHADKTYEVSVTFVEVYQERIYDLLDPNNTDDVAIQEDSKGNITVRGVSNKVCRQEAEALAFLFEGNSNRVTAEHSMNSQSSRSHTIFTMHVTSRSRVESESASLVSKLHCIDLAGSERLSKTGSTEGKLVREAQFINKSLTFLEQVVMALGSTTRSHVPFRQSKLTNLLKDSLGGNSKTTMIANVWPEQRHMEETISTFKFAARMMRVQTEASVNVLLDPSTHIKQLQRQISDLKSELQMQNQLVGKSHIVYEGEIGPDERYEMEKVVRGYIAGSVQEVPVRSLREVKEYFKVFKAFVDTKDAELRTDAPTDAHAAVGAGGKAGAAGTAAGGKKGAAPMDVDAIGQGNIDGSAGFSVGVAAPAKNLKDLNKTGNPQSPQRQQQHQEADVMTPTRGTNGGGTAEELEESYQQGGGLDTAYPGGGGNGYREMPAKPAAFEDFKATEGSRFVQALREAQQQHMAKRKKAAELSSKVNDIKVQIDSFAFQLEQKRLDRQARGEDEIVDDEEFEIVRLVKDRKAEYRACYDQLNAVKAEREHYSKNVENTKGKLLSEFEAWFDGTFGGPSKTAKALASARRSISGAAGKSGMGASSGGYASGGGGGGSGDEDDMLDEGERFEILELNRVMGEDPDSVAFYSAKKMTQSKAALGASRPKQGAPRPNKRR